VPSLRSSPHLPPVSDGLAARSAFLLQGERLRQRQRALRCRVVRLRLRPRGSRRRRGERDATGPGGSMRDSECWGGDVRGLPLGLPSGPGSFTSADKRIGSGQPQRPLLLFGLGGVFSVQMDLPCMVLWGPEALHCRELIPPEAWNGLTPNPPSVGFEPRTSCIRADPLPTELSVSLHTWAVSCYIVLPRAFRARYREMWM